MSIKYIEGDLFKLLPTSSNIPMLIPHICNNQNKWGAGFVLALSKWHKRPEERYRALFNNDLMCSKDVLGFTQMVYIGDNCYVANMIAQNETIKTNERPLQYSSLIECMASITNFSWLYPNGEIHAPKFGSGLAGGKWEFIEDLIEEIWCPHFKVTVYEY